MKVSSPRQLHTPTNLLLLSLAVSDLFVGLLLMPVEIIYIEACWFLGDVLCTLYYVVDYVVTSASVASMVLISIDRYVAVCYPFYYSTKVTNRRVKRIVFLCWLCSILYRIVLLKDHLERPGHSSTCLGECVVVIDNLAGVVDLIFTFVLPITVIIVLYTRVFVVVLSAVRSIKSQVTAVTPRPPVATKRSEIKAARILGVVVVVFLLCFCPYYFPTLAGEDTSVNASFVAVEIWLAHFNSCLNPVIYVFFYPWFRKCIRLIFTLQIFKPGSSNVVIIQ